MCETYVKCRNRTIMCEIYIKYRNRIIMCETYVKYHQFTNYNFDISTQYMFDI